MFGTYRVILALMVAFGHLAGISNVGAYAVFGFYILSGYLMTLIMHSGYGYSWDGLRRYGVNRFLRIYPLYWLSILITLGAIFWLGATSVEEYHHAMRMPPDWASGLQNIFLIFPPHVEPRLTPPSWALTIEIFYYCCIGLGFSRTLQRTQLWFGLSLAYTVYVNMAGFDFDYKYYLVPAASLPFATGALIFMYKDKVAAGYHIFRQPSAVVVLFVLYFANYAISRKLGVLDSWGFYISYLLNAFLVITLAVGAFPFVSRRMDNFLGNFSYPIYLIHLQAGLLLLAIGVPFVRGQTVFALAAIPLVLLLSWILIKVVEAPIGRLRKKFKKPARDSCTHSAQVT